MPRVSYMIPQQGFRPKTNPLHALAGLRGIGKRGVGFGALGDAAPTGSFLKYQAQWQTTQNQSAGDIMQAVTSALASDGLPVVQASSDASTKAFILGAFGVTFNVTLVLQVAGSGFAQESDAGSIVNHEVYAATGLMPLSSSVMVSSTGPGGSGGGSPPAPPGAPTDWGTWLQSNAWWIAAAAIGAAVVRSFL